MSRAPKRAETGYTLTEVLVAVTILSVSIVVILAAMSDGILASRVHRNIVTSDAVARTYADQIIAGPYVACATKTTPVYQMTNPPAGYTASITSITYWIAGSKPATFGSACPPDAGAQQISISVSSTTGPGAQALQFVKRQP
jgi:prepilin-type N-terminal cleavage/methylation domain-containing protein